MRNFWKRASRVAPSDLTSRQREIAQMIAEGNAYKVIATELKISPKTVAWNAVRIFKKMGLPLHQRFRDLHVVMVTRWAVAYHLIELEEFYNPMA